MKETENSKKYHFKDFTYSSYRNLLKLAKKNYTCATFDSFKKKDRFVLWRHDIDASVHSALHIAKIEAEEKIKATYFVHLHNPFYHFYEKEIFEILNEISKLGHSIGLHFDSHFYGIEDENRLEELLHFEKSIIEKSLQVKVNTFSFHNTTPFTMACQKWEYAGMINTYASYFKNEVGYCSDSNGIWRFRRMEDVLTEAKENQLQLLTHPEMWQSEILSPRQRIHYCIDGKARKNKFNYDNDLKEFGRENIDWSNTFL